MSFRSARLRRPVRLRGMVAVVVALAALPALASASHSKHGRGYGSPIIIGNVGTYSGPVGSSQSSVPTVLQAWARYVDSQGGINHHPVRIISADDALSPATNLSETETQYQQDHAIGFVSNMIEDTLEGSEAYIDAHHIPVVGGDLNDTHWFSDPNYFAQGISGKTLRYGVVQMAQERGAKKWDIWACTESPICKVFQQDEAFWVRQDGGKVLSTTSMSLAQPSFAAQCLNAVQEGANVIEPNVDPSTAVRVGSDCASQGFRGLIDCSSNCLSSSFLADTSSTQIGPLGDFPWFETSGSPAFSLYGRVMKRYASSVIRNAGTTQAWASAILLQTALEAGISANSKPSTAGLLKGLYTIKNTTLGGLTTPLTFTRGRPSPQGSCWFPVIISKGKESWSGKLECAKHPIGAEPKTD